MPDLMPPPLSPGRALLYGTLAVATLDLLDAFVFFGVRGVPPVPILQSIASGLLGRAAYQGGLATAALGLGLHGVIGCAVVATYHAAARRLGVLVRHPFACGALYGVAVYLVMYEVVLPLSAAVTGPRPGVVVVNGLLVHVLGVGVPAAWFAHAASGGARGEAE